jgi:peptidoglycan/xylan/chitin deacetylase (PgdA/CDA1 family)
MSPVSDYARHLSRGRLAIFLFHGVIPRHRHRVRNYTRKHIDRKTFQGVIRALLSAGGVPLSMDDVRRHVVEQVAYPPRAFAVTFDDGFANNATVAAPCLEEAGVPAMFYVTTGFVDGKGASWTDRLEFAVESRRRFSVDWPSLGIDGIFSTVDEKIALLEALRKRIKSDRRLDPYAVADDFRRRIGAPTFDAEPDLDAKLTWKQVGTLARHDLFSVGGHGHTHRILSFLTKEDLASEVATSLRILRRRLHRPVEHYSYPEGMSHCFNERVVRVLRSSGVRCCPTAIPGVNPLSSDLFQIGRASCRERVS